MQRAMSSLGSIVADRLPGHTAGGGSSRQRRQAARGRQAVMTRAGLFGDLFDFEKWAPRSSQAWRLGNGADLHRGKQGKEDSMTVEDVEVLNQRLAEARTAPGAAGRATSEAAAEAAAGAEPQPSFLRSTDEEFANALNERIAEVASLGSSSTAAASTRSSGGGVDVAEGEDEEDGGVEGGALTGPLLRQLIYNKWGKAYDLSFVRRDPPLGKTLICLNVMWTHLEQRSFPMTEEEYNEKLDLIALYLNAWGQSERVEAFLRQPPRPRNGMPSKPIVGVAVSIQLDPDESVIEEFFSQGGV